MEDIGKILEERGNNYGDYKGNAILRSRIMHLIKERYYDIHNHDMPLLYETYIYDVVTKLSRIAVTPRHLDSWVDVLGYSKLIIEEMDCV